MSVLILKCEKSEEETIFTPLGRWENSRWAKIKIPDEWINVPDEYRPLGYRKKICYPQKYELYSLVLAEIDNDKNSCQIQQPFCGLVKRNLEKNNLPEKVSIRDNYNWNNKKIYFYSESENITVGPYLLKKKKDEWIAYAEIKEKLFINHYKYVDVMISEYFYDEDEKVGYHFLPGGIESQKFIISDKKLFEYILSRLSNTDISEACDKIRAFTNQSGALSTLFEDSFNWSIDEIKDRFFKILTDDMRRKGELLQKVLQVLKDHPVIKSEIEKYKQAEWVKEENKIKQELEMRKQYLSEELEQKLEPKRRKLEQELGAKREELKKAKEKLRSVSDQIREDKKSSEEAQKMIKKELSEYVKQGEKWRDVLFSNLRNESGVPENKIFTVLQWDDENVIESYSDFQERLSEVDDDSRISQAINQFEQKCIYYINGIEDLAKLEKFFEAIGHKKGRFILNADNSWLTPESLWKTKGYLSEHNKLITLPYLFKIAEKNEKFIFQIEILGADRAPIEGYFGPLLKAMERKESVVAQDVLINIPDNVFFFLQLDKDEYTAKPSEWLKNRLGSIQLPSVQHMPKNIAIPYNVLLRKDE